MTPSEALHFASQLDEHQHPKRTAEYQSADDVERVPTARQESTTSCNKVEKSDERMAHRPITAPRHCTVATLARQ